MARRGEGLTDFAAGADALVVSLGVDAAADDPESPLQVTAVQVQGRVPAGFPDSSQ